MRAAAWRGIFPAICTPFTRDGGIDVESQRRVVRFAIESGSHGLVAFGLAGEVLELNAEERERLTDAIVDETAGAVPVFVGVGASISVPPNVSLVMQSGPVPRAL